MIDPESPVGVHPGSRGELQRRDDAHTLDQGRPILIINYSHRCTPVRHREGRRMSHTGEETSLIEICDCGIDVSLT
jgi:hypothetical protein